MMNFTDLASVRSHPLAQFTDRLRLAVAAYLVRPHLELYIRSMQEIRQFKPSTVSRRFSVAAGFHRTCALDGIIEHSPAEHVRRPAVPAESPTLGFTHLQFEALLTAARDSANRYDFALVAMLGLRVCEYERSPGQVRGKPPAEYPPMRPGFHQIRVRHRPFHRAQPLPRRTRERLQLRSSRAGPRSADGMLG